jgi:hypothetical protein
MHQIARRTTAGKSLFLPRIAQAPAARLMALAREVERLAIGSRLDPETVVVAKLDLAHRMRSLARELDR